MVFRSLLLGLVLLATATASAAVHAQTKSDEFCLALTAFTEAKSEGEQGMALVAHTVLNRSKSRKQTICQVAYAPNQYHGVLYWPKQRSPSGTLWELALKVANEAIDGKHQLGSCKGAQYFYAPKAVRRVPRWAYTLPFKCEYKGHRFYGSK